MRDLTVADGAVPVRLVGYGLVVGLDGTGDRASGRSGAAHTVQSTVNLLRRFDVDVPAEVLQTRNVAAVLVTAEVSPYLRPGARFEVQVSSVGDARSLRGGVLWMTPLVADAGGPVFGTAQGAVVSAVENERDRYARADQGGASVRVPGGGLVEGDLPRPSFAQSSRLLLREPNLGTAVRVAEAVNNAIGAGTATVEDPGSIALTVPQGEAAATLARIGELTVRPDRPARLVIDGRDGTVVAGGDLRVGEAVVSHGAITLTVGGTGGGNGAEGAVRVAAGTPVQDVAAALHAVNAPAAEIAAIFQSLREVGALSAEVVVR
ncbi:flagellar basal body P-ring protein FlgI [Longimicrobium sp.]|uniref:flagellar basal body P-ring protein FlgI n=1 Tax=Longimicrobium sp. TaxID=2029185 RepID=UPI002E30CF0A|nr:flagellar basal body P-ring protein FlgI [Longimicrobium sp.]HEX6039235.1 flagellar basal body P-ring protein FlgI [Longimicrobium sp.]